MIEHINFFILRDIEKVKAEIEQYSAEEVLWRTAGDITNSAGNLCLHIIGNLNHFIGAQLGDSGYERHRDLEFSNANVPRQILVTDLDNTRTVIANTMDRLVEGNLDDIYPLEVFGEKITTGWFLMHLATHLNYHLGQINYHRRLFDTK